MLKPDPAAVDARTIVRAETARAGAIGPFEVMEVLARAQALEAAGRRIVHMEIGEPDFTAPPLVVEAAIRALRAGTTAYTVALGLDALREAIAGHQSTRLGAPVDASRVAVTAGASGALLLVAALYVGPGDEVLVPDPGYPGYRHIVRAFEGVPRALAVGPESAFQPTLEAVQAAWGPRTIGLLLGSPSNPAGTLIPRTELARIADFVAARGGVLIIDEIYQGLVYDESPRSAADLPGEVVLVNSFSKYFCMTGWRLGWAILPAARIKAFERLAQHLFICPPTVAQHAALAAFEPATLGILEARRTEFRRRRDLIVPGLRAAGLGVPVVPGGAFYVYADCSAQAPDARAFALALLEDGGVAATPGADFGAHAARRYVRFAYTRSMDDMEEAVRRITAFCRGR